MLGFPDKTIILGIASSVAIYKIPELIRKLRAKNADLPDRQAMPTGRQATPLGGQATPFGGQATPFGGQATPFGGQATPFGGQEARVCVLMTKHATRLLSPQILQAVSGHPVSFQLFDPKKAEMPHLSLADQADLILIAPATANIIGKIANGIADDLLTTTVMASRVPVLIAPAMNEKMWLNSIVQENVRKLKKHGCQFIGPEKGELACGKVGWGRMADLDLIVNEVEMVLTKKDLKNKQILITAGPTQELWDPVRFLSNYSSGKMGYALAKRAALRGAKVILISGPANLKTPLGVTRIEVQTAREMERAVRSHFQKCQVFISAAAVCDFRPKEKLKTKTKKGRRLILELERNPDILAGVSRLIGQSKKKKILIGFALETENLEKNARSKLKEKKLDFIAASGLKNLGRDEGEVLLISADSSFKKKIQGSKEELAEEILNLIA